MVDTKHSATWSLELEDRGPEIVAGARAFEGLIRQFARDHKDTSSIQLIPGEGLRGSWDAAQHAERHLEAALLEGTQPERIRGFARALRVMLQGGLENALVIREDYDAIEELDGELDVRQMMIDNEGARLS